MSAGASQVKQERGPKTRGTEWWTPPPDTPLNLAIPYVVSIVDDGLSLPQSRVLACLTNTADGAKRQEREVDDQGKQTKPRGFLCDPGGYSRIARKTGLCRKTVYNAIKALIKKGVLLPWKVIWKGRQRVKTLYFALHYGDILPAWRASKEWFHTAHKSSVVVRKRSKQFMTVEEAREWQMDPARAPKRGCGRGLTEIVTEIVPDGVAEMPAPPSDSDEDLGMVLMELQLATDGACFKDAIDIIADARAEAKRMGYAELGYGGQFPALTVAEMIQKAAADYKPKREYLAGGGERVAHPKPTPGWFLGGAIRRQVAKYLKFEWEQKQG